MAKRSMAILMALAAVILHRFLLRLGLHRGALPAVIAAFLGSDLWPLASQAAWQHGPAALALIVALASLHPGPVSRWRMVLAGIATALLFTMRLLDSIFAAVIFAWIVRSQPLRLGWFLSTTVLGATWLLHYNYRYFGTILGGLAQLEEMHPQFHGVAGTWSGTLAGGRRAPC